LPPNATTLATGCMVGIGSTPRFSLKAPSWDTAQMQIDRGDLDAAVSRRIVDAGQAAALWRFFGERYPTRARVSGLNVAYFVAALLALRRVKFPFLVAPAAVALWFMSMDFAAYLAGDRHWQLALGQRVSITFGLAMLFVAYLVDHRTREDFAFWLYLFGMTALWAAITSMDSGSEWRRF